MTTSVIVRANHGWSVKVVAVNPKDGNWLNEGAIVLPGEHRTFYVHSGMDLIIHEMPPIEDEPVASWVEKGVKGRKLANRLLGRRP